MMAMTSMCGGEREKRKFFLFGEQCACLQLCVCVLFCGVAVGRCIHISS